MIIIFAKAFFQLALLCGGVCIMLLITIFVADLAYGSRKNAAHRIVLDTTAQVFILGLVLAGLGMIINVM